MRTRVAIVTRRVTVLTSIRFRITDILGAQLPIVTISNRQAGDDTVGILRVDVVLTSSISPFFAEVDGALIPVITRIGIRITAFAEFQIRITTCGLAVVHSTDIAVIAFAVGLILILALEGVRIATVYRAGIAVVTRQGVLNMFAVR